jgi:hypothetical protein
MAGASLPNPTFRSAILRLPAHQRTAALNKLSANANAHGGAKRHTKGRIQGVAARGLRNALGIYLIEVNPTGPLAASVGGATPASITIEGGTPASAAIAANELDPVTWAAPGPKSLTVQVGTELAGNAKVTV